MSRNSENHPRWLVLMASIFLFLIITSSALSQRENTKYGPRGDYWEGTRSDNVSGPTLILVSALAGDNYQQIGIQQTRELPEAFKIRFYLYKPSSVSVEVQERRKKTYYWLDRVTRTWQLGRSNHFEWLTHKVIKPLGLSMDDLGVVVSLDKENEDDSITRVAPAIFYDNHSRPPDRVTHYEFSFRSTKGGKFDYEVYQEGAKTPVLSRKKGGDWVNPGSPIPAWWDASSAPEGDYVLYANLTPRNSNTPVPQIVKFHHKRMLQ